MSGSMKSIAGGKMTFTAKKIRVESTEENLQLHSAQDTVFNAKGKITYDEYVPRDNAINIVRGWWTDTEDNPITEAVAGDRVHFHIETRGIPSGGFVFISLFDDDRLLNPDEDKKDDPQPLEKTGTGTPYLGGRVQNGRVKTVITLRYMEKLIAEEPDRMLELYCRVSYGKQNTDLPRSTDDYLKVIALPLYIDRYKIPGLNNAMNEIADDMAYGYGVEHAEPIYGNTRELASYKSDYQGNGFNEAAHALFSNAANLATLPSITPVPETNSPGTVPIDKVRVSRPDPIVIENARIHTLNQSRKAVYSRQEMYSATYHLPIKYTSWSIPISTGLDIWLFDKLSDDILFFDFEKTVKLYFASGPLDGNISRMIAKFRGNDGGVYEDPALTTAINADPNTEIFCAAIEAEMKNRIAAQGGVIRKIKDDFIYNADTYNRDYKRIKYDNDKRGGLTIATNDIWAYEVSLVEYKRTGSAYGGKYKVVLWDHFGLDLPDMEHGFNVIPSVGEAFVTWFILQHLRGYKPFITKVVIERTFEGTIK